MKVKWIVTGELFGELDMDEAHLSLPLRPNDGSELVIQQSGIILHTSMRDWPAAFTLPKAQFDPMTENGYINGTSRITFSNALDYKLTVSLFDRTGRSFLRDVNGNLFELHHECAIESQTPIGNKATQLYDFSGVLDWPSGDCQLQVRAWGIVTFEFDSADCISVLEYGRRCIEQQKARQ